MYALFHRQSDVGLQETEGGFRTQVYTATDPADIDYDSVRAELNCYIAICHSYWTVSTSNWIVVYTDASFADGKTGID
jgi:hypothetical protein